MQTMRAPVPPQHLYAFVALAAVTIVFLAMWPKARTTAIMDSRCELWDMEATAVLAAMIGSRNEMADAQLGDAVFRLRRARTYCRNGFSNMAQLDYDALMSNRYDFRR